MTPEQLPSRERLLELLDYSPRTGLFFWRRVPEINGRASYRNRRWAGKIAGHRDALGYWIIKVDGKSYKAHRLAWVISVADPGPLSIDHINGETTDNRLANLRAVSHSLNIANSRISVRNKSGFKGVSWHKSVKRWVAQINTGGRVRSLGLFKSPEEAHAVYRKAATEAFGECARLE